MKLQLSGGAYQARSVISSAQRSLNLYSEGLPEAQGEPSAHANYPTPGTTLLGTIGTGPIRAIRQATTGGIYVVSGSIVYSVAADWTGTVLGSITAGLITPVSMADNGLDLVIVDGTAGGWKVTLADNSFAAINDPTGSFRGADRVDYLDTFFVFNAPGTPQFYWSLSEDITFDEFAGDFGSKTIYGDLLRTLIVAKREIYLLGDRTTEIWYDVGAQDIAGSQFAPVQGVFIDHGIVAKYSVANYDNGVFWLSRDRQGQGIVLEAADYKTKRVSTYAIEAEIAGYARIDDAIGYCYQLAGHAFYVLTFPNADKTWVYDVTTGLWHEWAWLDSNGREHRHRSNCHCPVGGSNVVGDWQDGNLYALDLDAFTDNGRPIKRQRSFPHVVNELDRVFYRQFIADMEGGNPGAPPSSSPSPSAPGGFSRLPLVPGGLRGNAYAISADGQIVTGSVSPAGDNGGNVVIACYWTDGGASGPFLIGPNNDLTEAVGASGDGAVIVGNYTQTGHPAPFVWTAATGTVSFATAADALAGISADGTTIIGSTAVGSLRQASFWNRAGTRTNLGYLPGHNVSRARGVSADGRFITGESFASPSPGLNQARAFLWSAAAGMVNLGVAGTATGSRGYGVSDDGAVVAGDLKEINNPSGFRWTSAGMVELLPDVSPGGTATSVSGDGSTVAGQAGYGGDLFTHYLAYWTGAGMTVPTPIALDPGFPDVLYETYPTGISHDGMTMVGYTLPFSHTFPWVYRVPVPGGPGVTAATSHNLVFLDWSDDRGHSFGSPVGQPIGATGEYRTNCQWRRLGYARSRVFRLTWSVPVATALQGAYLEAEAEHQTESGKKA